MFSFFYTGGLFMWPLLIMAIIIIILVVKKLIELFFKTELPVVQLEYGIHAILFWGILSAVLGILAQLTGIFNALSEIIAADNISPEICLRGYQVSFITTLFGLHILIGSAISWFILRWRFNKLTMNN